jgi:hypothetical protein
MSAFLERHLPRTDQVVSSYLQWSRGLPPAVQPMDERRPDYAALGRTIDYRLRLSLGSGPGDAVTAGIALLGSSLAIEGAPSFEVRRALHTAGSQLLDRLQAHLNGMHQLSEEELTRLCHVAGFYEAVYRNGVFSRRRNLLALADARTTLSHLTAAVPAYVVEDIAEQVKLAEQPFEPFRQLPDGHRLCGPVFAGSSDLGGADADFIVGGLLIDCKATTRPHTIHRSAVQQLAGYLLLDYDDTYGIDQVGLYLSRQGALITWRVPDFLNALGSRVPLPKLRTLLRDDLRRAKRTMPTRSE